MASSNKQSTSSSSKCAALFLSLNLLFFSLVRSADVDDTCPIDTSTLGGCASLLGLAKVDAEAGNTDTCCGLLAALTDLQVAVCLCATIDAGILGVVLDADLALTVLLGACGRTRPAGYICT